MAAARWADAQWWSALLAGPAFCLVLAATGTPTTDPARVLVRPEVYLLLVLVYPVLEELVFRGMIQERLSRLLQPWSGGLVSKANLITSLLFAALHGFSHPPLWAAAVFVPSLVYGHFRERHGGLASPIMLHAFYNGVYFALFGTP